MELVDFDGRRGYTHKSNMRPSIFLLLLCIRSIAADPGAPLPDERLLRLEQTLTRKLEDRKQGQLPPDQYREFAAKFRVELDGALAQSPDTPVNRGRHAMVLARLDDAGPGQAVAGLDRALEERPEDAALLNAKGSILLQQGDYAGALVAAEAVLKRNQERGELPDPVAVAIRQFSKGRGTAPRGSSTAASPNSQSANDSTAAVGPTPIQFTQRAARQRVEIPSVSAEDSTQSSGRAAASGALEWTQRKITGAQQDVVNWLDGKMGFKPDEKEKALTGTLFGAIAGTAIGVVGGAYVGSVACAPGAVTGGPYGQCIAAGGAGGIIVGAPTGAFAGGFSTVMYSRLTGMINKIFDKEVSAE